MSEQRDPKSDENDLGGVERFEAFDVMIRGIRVRYIDAGARQAPTVLCLHALGRDHRQFAALIDLLSDRFRFVAVDLPGFGASEATRSPPSYEALAEATLDLVATLNLGRITLAGHSMGGAIALAAAADRPEFVSRLILIAPDCYPVPERADERLVRLPLVGPAVFSKVVGPRVLLRHGGSDASLTPTALAMFRRSASPATIEARLPKVRAPALVIWGRRDAVAPWTHGTRLARELYGARLEILDSGHFPEQEDAASVAQLVTDFMDPRTRPSSVRVRE